ncbi:lipopolysaccharide heptosyltransferase family protein [bacterium]|nr:lipopolysaccharide heptosyltransferase family protein [bacterium]
MAVDGSPRILITRLSAIGDGILTMPVLCSLRRRFPNAFLSWVAEPGAAQLLRGHECLDELIVVPKGWLKSPSEVLKLRRHLRSLRFDSVVDPQSLTRSAIVGWLSGASQRIGFTHPFGREFSLVLNNCRVPRTISHVVPGNLQLLEPLGIESPEVEFRVPTDELAETRADEFVRQNGLSDGFVVLNTGAGWESKRWPEERYAEVASQLWQRQGLRSVIVWAGPQERAWAESIVAAATSASLLAPDTTMPELASLLRRCSLFVGSDTGPLHLAAAIGIPCVGLYGPTSPSISGPFGSQHLVIQACEDPGRNRMRHDNSDPMREIMIEPVTDACVEILRRHSVAAG